MTATSPNFVLLDVSRPEIANLPDRSIVRLADLA
jgi:hypothetical protein